MKEAVIEISFALATLVVIFEITIALVFGSFISKAKIKAYLDERWDRFERNGSIIGYYFKYDGMFIAEHHETILSKYYVSGMGRVWRWSKAHRRINELYKRLEKK